MKITAEHEPLSEHEPNQGGQSYAKITPTTNDLMADHGFHHRPSLVIEQEATNKQDSEPKAKPLKVAIIGTAPSSRDLAPFDDLSWEIWGTSPGNVNVLRRVTRWVEVHSNLLWPENKHYGEPYVQWMKQQKTIPIYMQDQSIVPHAIVIPKDDLVKKYGPYFFSSTFAWAMAMAMEMGAVEIGLYGVDMASRQEYILQRPGGHYFIELARQRGIKVIIPPESDLLQPPPLYGYSHSTAFGRKVAARKQEILGRISNMTAERDRLNNGITYLQGALEDIEYIDSIWTGVG